MGPPVRGLARALPRVHDSGLLDLWRRPGFIKSHAVRFANTGLLRRPESRRAPPLAALELRPVHDGLGPGLRLVQGLRAAQITEAAVLERARGRREQGQGAVIIFCVV